MIDLSLTSVVRRTRCTLGQDLLFYVLECQFALPCFLSPIFTLTTLRSNALKAATRMEFSPKDKSNSQISTSTLLFVVPLSVCHSGRMHGLKSVEKFFLFEFLVMRKQVEFSHRQFQIHPSNSRSQDINFNSQTEIYLYAHGDAARTSPNTR
jgi:hypothetical protein